MHRLRLCAGTLVTAGLSFTFLNLFCLPALAVGPLSHSSSEFFPVVQSSGTQAIEVHCGRSPGPVISFGMPFPRGFVTDSAQVRLETLTGTEIAADVVELLRWYDFSEPGVDGKSIRSVLVTFHPDCSPGKTLPYRVRWGAARQLRAQLAIGPADVAARTWIAKEAPQSDEGPFTDNYEYDAKASPLTEPAAWVTLPPDWLAKLILRGPTADMTDKKARTQWLEFAKTFVNDVSRDVVAYQSADKPGLIDWSTEVEAWLYDRPFALWNVYIATGDVRWLRHAHRASQYYASWIAIDGSRSPQQRGAFLKKPLDYPQDPGDAKYSLAGGLLADYMLTGDARLLERIRAVADFTGAYVNTRLFPASKTSGLWTERHSAAALSAALYAYEATGERKYRDRVKDIIGGFVADIAQPPDGYPDMHGILLHRPEVHEGDSYQDWIMSPWMSALLGEALWRYYIDSDDRRALQIIGSYAQFIAEHALYSDKNDAHLSGYTYPYYISGLKAGHTDNGPNDDKEHAYDVLGLLVRGRWARQALGEGTEVIDPQIARLHKTAQFNFDDWIRDSPGLPRYRLSPTRKFGWWYGTTFDLAWFERPH
jgi:hypothetical protein